MNRKRQRPSSKNESGRGARVRCGRSGPGRPGSPVAEVVDVVVPDRDGPGRRCRTRGGHVKARHKLPRSRTFDKLEIRDITELPEGRGLETPLHPKRMRVRLPSNPAPTPSPSLVAASSPAPPSPALTSTPSPTKSKKRSSLAPRSPLTTPTKHPHTPPPPRDPSFINHGSDDDSDDGNDNEDEIVAPVIPRRFRSLMEASLDYVTANEDTAGDLAPAGEHDPEDALAIMTEQPWGLNYFDWRAFPNPPIPPQSRREIFSKINVGPTTPCADPYDIFVEIWDRPIMEHIASETNKYARRLVNEMFENHSLCPRSRITRWYDTTADELYIYFGMILAMGIVVKSNMQEYWSATPDIFFTPGFGAHMPIDRFQLLSTCLHFNDNDNMCALKLDISEARLYKIQPLLSHLNKKFETMYTPGQNIALDESLLMWKGSLDISQLIPNKAACRGIKTYEICESQTGYLWRFEVHTLKKSPPPQTEDPLQATIPAIVLRMVRGLEHKGYTLWMDNYYQSPALGRRLKCLGFDCVGTMRPYRKYVPQELCNLTKMHMKRGEITGFTSGDVDIMLWRDMNMVTMISTYHGNGQQTVNGSTKPILIMDYNIMMGGVDKKDQLLAMYPIERNRNRVWYKKLFRRLLNISVLNSYIIHRQTSTSTLSHRNFRMALIKSLLTKYYSPSPFPSHIKPSSVQLGKPDITHRLAEYPYGRNQRLRRQCAACNKRIHTYCVGCNKAVCINECFVKIHS